MLSSISAVCSMSVLSYVSCVALVSVIIVIAVVLSVACCVKTLLIFVIKLAKVTAKPLMAGVRALHCSSTLLKLCCVPKIPV